MKNSRFISVILLALGVALSGQAMADHGHWEGHEHGGHFGLYFGVPIGPYYPYPYYTYPDPYYYPPVQTQPPVYIEQSPQPQIEPPTAPQSNNYWYHCNNPDGYYPYVKDCPGGWVKVVPTPPPQQ